MPPRKRPGPLSSKAGNRSGASNRRSTRESQQSVGLGDETATEQSDSESSENVDRRQTSHATDYGLEFTNSSLNISPPTRYSTLIRHSPVRPTERSRESDDEQPSTSVASRLANLTVSRESRRADSLGSRRRQQTESGAVEPTRRPEPTRKDNRPPVGAHRRKQRTPQQRDRRFMKEVRELRNRIDYLIPRAAFGRVVREILMERCGNEMCRVTVTCLEALQTAAESYLAQRLEDAYLLTLHRGRVTLELRDLRLVSFLKTGIH